MAAAIFRGQTHRARGVTARLEAIAIMPFYLLDGHARHIARLLWAIYISRFYIYFHFSLLSLKPAFHMRMLLFFLSPRLT